MGGQGLLLLMELKALKMMTRPQNITRQATVMFCDLVISIKTFNSINSRRPWPPILISHLFQHGLFKFLAATFFTPGVFWLGLLLLAAMTYNQVQSFQVNDYANHDVDIEITGYRELYSINCKQQCLHVYNMCVCVASTLRVLLAITQLSDLAIITVQTYCKQLHRRLRYLIPLVNMLCATLLTRS